MHEETLTLDDLLLGDAGLVPYGQDAATHALMAASATCSWSMVPRIIGLTFAAARWSAST
ncbi:MAG: hypothetical protein R2882_11495 [Gemmatimonadales bacterium]